MSRKLLAFSALVIFLIMPLGSLAQDALGTDPALTGASDASTGDDQGIVYARLGEGFRVSIAPEGRLVVLEGYAEELKLIVYPGETCPDASCIRVMILRGISIPVIADLYPGRAKEIPGLSVSLIASDGVTASMLVKESACTPSWVCGEWSGCRDGMQWRDCRDIRACDETSSRPPISQACTEDVQEPSEAPQDNTSTGETPSTGTPSVSPSDTPNATEPAKPVSECAEIRHCNDFGGCVNGIRVRRCFMAGNCTNEISEEWTDTERCETEAYSPGARNDSAPVQSRMMISDASPGKDAVVEPGTDSVSVSEIRLRVRNRVQNAEVSVKRLDTEPAQLREAIAKRVYEYLEINKSGIGDSDMGNATISFHVTKMWIAMNSIDMETVRLHRYHNDQWEDLPTVMVSEDDGNVYYSAQTEGFSIFAIAGDYILQFSGGICLPMDRRCDNRTLEECSVDGNEWVFVEECSYACINEECVPEPEAGIIIDQNAIITAMVVIIVLLLIIAVFMRFRKKKAMQDLKDMTEKK